MLLQVEQVDETHFRIVDQWEGFRGLGLIFKYHQLSFCSSQSPCFVSTFGLTFYIQGACSPEDNASVNVEVYNQEELISALQELNKFPLIEKPGYSYVELFDTVMIRTSLSLYDTIMSSYTRIPVRNSYCDNWINFKIAIRDFPKFQNFLTDINICKFPEKPPVNISKQFFQEIEIFEV